MRPWVRLANTARQDTRLHQQSLDKLLPTDRGLPKGVDPVMWSGIYVPADNVLTPERIALGRKLYFDAHLSRDGTVSCATCHDVSRGFTDHRNVSEGVGDRLGRRSAPTTLNAALLQSMFGTEERRAWKSRRSYLS